MICRKFWPLICALLLHILLFSFLLLKFRPSAPVASTLSIIHAVAVSSPPVAKMPVTPVQEIPKPLLPLPPDKKIERTEPEVRDNDNKKDILPERKLITPKAVSQKRQKPEITKEPPKKAKSPAEAAKPAKAKPEQAKPQPQVKQEAEPNIKKETLDKKAQQEKAAAELKKQLAAEAEQLTATAAENAHIQAEVNKYKSIVLAAISQHWIVPDNAKKGLSCKLRIRTAPGGMVLNVTLVSSSGDSALDRSAIAAVNKASPLPVPQELAVFEQFREIDLTVQPE